MLMPSVDRRARGGIVELVKRVAAARCIVICRETESSTCIKLKFRRSQQSPAAQHDFAERYFPVSSASCNKCG